MSIETTLKVSIGLLCAAALAQFGLSSSLLEVGCTQAANWVAIAGLCTAGAATVPYGLLWWLYLER